MEKYMLKICHNLRLGKYHKGHASHSAKFELDQNFMSNTNRISSIEAK